MLDKSNYFNSFIAACNHNILNADNQESKQALSYLLSRGIEKETIKAHNLGYCLASQYIPLKFKKFEGRSSVWDISKFLHGRIIVPVYGEFSRPVGFSTREFLFSSDVKWWNMPYPFQTGSNLYLLHKAKREIFDQDKVYVVEGYFDALLLYQRGLKNVVAIMGTQITNVQLALIFRYAANICFCFDSDENKAGEKAQKKSLEMIRELNYHDRVTVIDGLPVGEDPASYVLEHGLNNFLNYERVLTPEDLGYVV